MARKSAGKNIRNNRRVKQLDEIPSMNARESRNDTGSRRGSVEDSDMREILKEFLTSPTVKYIAGGLATALLSRLATNLSGRYPEISNFIRDNMSSLEERFGDFKGNLNRDDLASRH